MDTDIKNLRARLAELRAERDALRDTRRSPMLDNSGGSKARYRRRSVVEGTAERIQKVEAIIAETEAKLNEKRRQVLEKVAAQDSAALRVLYFYRIYECLTWEQIANITGEEADALRRRYTRNEKKYNS